MSNSILGREYDGEGERQHTIYLGATPEYGRKRFLERLEREIIQTKDRYPNATYVGIADGAESNWKFLNEHTEEQILDFYHASGYLGILAEVLHPKQIPEQKEWLIVVINLSMNLEVPINSTTRWCWR